MRQDNPIWNFIVDAAETLIAQARNDLETLPEKGPLEKPHIIRVESTPDVFKDPYLFAIMITSPSREFLRDNPDSRDKRMMEAVVVDQLAMYKADRMLSFGPVEKLKAKLAEEDIWQELCTKLYENYRMLEGDEYI